MTRVVIAAACALMVALPPGAEPIEGFPANASFEDGANGWSLDGAEATIEDGGARGRSALQIEDGWALSQVAELPAGWIAIDLRARAVDGPRTPGRLMLALTPDGEEPAAEAALTGKALGGGWQPVRVELYSRGGPARLAVGAEGGGRWMIDAISAETAEPQTPAIDPEPTLGGHPDEGWRPDGLMDAREREFGTARQLIVDVGSLAVTLSPEVETGRGLRGALRLTVDNRSVQDRELTVSVSAPPGFFVPDRTVPIPGGSTTIFDTSLQCFRTGTFTVAVHFESSGDRRSAPVEVTVVEGFPAIGVSTGGELPGDLPDALQMVAAPPGSAGPAGLTRLLLLEPGAAVRDLSGAQFAMIHHRRGEAGPDRPVEATVELAEALGVDGLPLTPPIDLSGRPPTATDDAIAMACELAGSAHAAPSLRLPPVSSRGVGEVTIGRTGAQVPQPAWTALARSLEIEGVVGAIRQQVRTPMFFADLAAESSGSEALDAVALARTMVICAWQGATGMTVLVRPEDCPPGATAWALFDDAGNPRRIVARAFAEMARELASAVPLAILSQSDEVGSSPDAEIGFRPFMRGDEGMIALWNNTGAQARIALEVRTPPLDVHTVSIGPSGVRRGYRPVFRFSEDAIKLNRPVVFVDLAPGELRMVSMQLASPHIGWLSKVEYAPKIPRERPRGKSFFEDWEERIIW